MIGFQFALAKFTDRKVPGQSPRNTTIAQNISRSWRAARDASSIEITAGRTKRRRLISSTPPELIELLKGTQMVSLFDIEFFSVSHGLLGLHPTFEAPQDIQHQEERKLTLPIALSMILFVLI